MYSEYLKVVRSLETELRDIGKTMRQAQGAAEHSRKLHAYDVVTETDLEVEQRIKTLLGRVDPKTQVFGEETGGDTSSNVYWTIDPIDGTIHFVRNMPFFTTMIALVVDGRPVVSVLYSYRTDEFFYAIKGEGAFLNDQRIQVSSRSMEEAVALIEMDQSKPSNAKLHGKFTNSLKTMNLVCAGYEFILVATGKVEARIIIEPFGKFYDFAPGVLLVQEAGGVVKNIKGEDYTVEDSDFIVAASQEIYDTLVAITKDE